VSALPVSAARASVEAELDAARVWAARHGWSITWDAEAMLLRAATYHPVARRLVELTGRTYGYRAIPPAWTFVRPGTEETCAEVFPAGGAMPGLGSIFHGNVVICAPWNRLAYSEHGGPHDNWFGPASWLQVREGTIAYTIPDMLAIIDVHLRASPGFMA
jgi:hypothetical protein